MIRQLAVALLFFQCIQATDYYPLDEYGQLLYTVLDAYVTPNNIVGREAVKRYLTFKECSKVINDAFSKGFSESDVLKCTFSIAANKDPQKLAILEGIQDKLLEHRTVKDAYLWSGFCYGCLSTLATIGLWIYIVWLHRTFKVNPYINYR